MALTTILAGPVPTGGAVGDAVHREVEVVEDDLLALDAQVPDTAYEAAAQPRLGDGTIVRVAAQVELLVQVQALELALGGPIDRGQVTHNQGALGEAAQQGHGVEVAQGQWCGVADGGHA